LLGALGSDPKDFSPLAIKEKRKECEPNLV
jgi:hypothetical protein